MLTFAEFCAALGVSADTAFSSTPKTGNRHRLLRSRPAAISRIRCRSGDQFPTSGRPDSSQCRQVSVSRLPAEGRMRSRMESSCSRSSKVGAGVLLFMICSLQQATRDTPAGAGVGVKEQRAYYTGSQVIDGEPGDCMHEVIAVAIIGASLIGLLNLGVHFSRKHWRAEKERRGRRHRPSREH